MMRLGFILLIGLPLGAAMGCASVEAPLPSPDALMQIQEGAELLGRRDDASYYELRFDRVSARWLAQDEVILALRPGEIELVAGDTVFVGEAQFVEAKDTPAGSKTGATYTIGLVGTDPQGAPAVLRLTAVLEAGGELRGTGVLDSDGNVTPVSFSARPTTQPGASEPCIDQSSRTHYHLPDGVHTRPRHACDQRTSQVD